jgi:uncharacterized coiled-coil DUF342 family protein
MSVKAMREPELASSHDAGDRDFQTLEEKIYRTIELLKEARQGRADAERETARLREQMRGQAGDSEAMRREVVELRREREDVRARVEKLLNQIDSLTADAPAR